MIFADRELAGRQLAKALERFRAERPTVLGVTRGGVPVACEVARELASPLDVVVVRKLGAPNYPEYALGAIAEGGALDLNDEAIGAAGLNDQEVRATVDREMEDLARRAGEIRDGRPPLDVIGRTVIIVDDGVATGTTARAAARCARQRGARRLVLAAPVIAAASAAELRADFEEIVALQTPAEFLTLRAWYDQFPRLSAYDVRDALRRAVTAATRGQERSLWDDEWNDSTAASRAELEERSVAIPFGRSAAGPGTLEGDLSVPPGARGLVVFVHGSGATRRNLRDRLAARLLRRAGFATLLFDLLTPHEMAEDAATRALRCDVELLTGRVLATLRWAAADPVVGALRVGCFGTGTGAAAALAAAAARSELVSAVVSLGGRPDLVDAPALADVLAPVLLIVSEQEAEIVALNRGALGHLARGELISIRDASQPEDPATLEPTVELAREWLERHLERASQGSCQASRECP